MDGKAKGTEGTRNKRIWRLQITLKCQETRVSHEKESKVIVEHDGPCILHFSLLNHKMNIALPEDFGCVHCSFT